MCVVIWMSEAQGKAIKLGEGIKLTFPGKPIL